MIFTKVLNPNSNKPNLVGEAPFSGFYTGFYFVPFYALQHMYDGVSPKSRYFSYNLIIKINKSAQPRTFAKYRRDFTPIPNLHLSKVFFLKYFKGWLEGKSKFLFFYPKTFGYDFFLGLFLFFVWQLGGGFRLSPLQDPTKFLNVFGFYDLRFTPLSLIFKFYVKFAFFYGFAKPRHFSDYYLFNKYSLTRGFMVPYLIHDKKIWGTNADPLNNFFFPLLTFIPEFIFCFFFHFILRPFFYFYFSFIGKLILKYESKTTLFDHFWAQVYAYYIDQVCSLLRSTGVPVRYNLRLKHISSISSFYYFQSKIFSKFWRRKFYRLFSYYGNYEFIFNNKFTIKLYRTSEYDKFEEFKLLVLLDAFKPVTPRNPLLFPDTSIFFKNYFENSYIFRTFMFRITKRLAQIPGIGELSPFFNKDFIKKFEFFTYSENKAIKTAYSQTYFYLGAYMFTRYKITSEWFKNQLSEIWPFKFFRFISFEYFFYDTLSLFVRFIFITFLFIWIPIAALPFVRPIIYFYNLRIKPYRVYLSSSKYKNSNFVLKFFGYFFYITFGVKVFEFYIETVYYSIYLFKQALWEIYKQLKTLFLFLYGWYSYIFWVFFRPILTIFFFLYLEMRYFGLFFVDFVRYYRIFSVSFYYYSIKEAYWSGFRKFFIGSKFFRFFTREIGEDLEETPYNNDQDFEDDYVSDYLSDFPAYEDFQSTSNSIDIGYRDEFDDVEFSQNHYYDYWYDHKTLNYNFLPTKPNLEFFAENYFEEENSLAFQLFCIWSSPTLFDFSDYSTLVPPYSKKDTYDITALKPRSWYPLELTQNHDPEEDQVEYHMDSGPDELEVSENTPRHIIPFDSDRARLNKFVRVYQKKLSTWHSYQIKNNFSKIPDALKYLPIPTSNLPTSLEHWKKATQAVSEFFFTQKQAKVFGFKFETFQELEIVWSRISYEIERNPRKFYDFLSNNSENLKIFDNFTFAQSSKNFKKFRLFEPPQNSNFIRYLNDYFLGYAGLKQMSQNKHYSSRNFHHNLFVINYLNFMANSDYKNFVSKFWLLSQFDHFSEIQKAFQLFIKHKSDNFTFEVQSNKFKFFEEIYAAQISFKLSQNYTPIFAGDYWKDEDGIAFWAFPHKIRRIFFRTLNVLAFRAPFTPKFSNLFNFYKSSKNRRKRKKKKKINKNDLLKVFAVWYRHERDLLFWRFSARGNSDHFHVIPYLKKDSIRAANYEKFFSTFLLDSFTSTKHTLRKTVLSYKSFMFRNYKPDGLFFQYVDGEDYTNSIRERRFHKTQLKRRAYFTYNQVIQGSLWSIFNPVLEDFFYEVYYLNTNIFFPAAFNDYTYSDFFPDDYKDSGSDIYDDYIFVGGDQDFHRGYGEGSEDLIVSPDEYGDEDMDTLEVPDETNWRSDEYIDYDSSADEGISYGDETGGENPVHYIERFWFNSDWFFFSEHVDSDEGFEEWEPDEFDSIYDLDHSIDRFFFGALKRSNHFPATDQRIFLGTLDEQIVSNIDKDLDYSKNFTVARSNSESKALISLSSAAINPISKNYFNFFKLYFLAFARISLYLLFAIRGGLLVFFFSNFDNPKYIKLLKARAHYINWYLQYNTFYNYKERISDWISFFEQFKSEKIFYNYVALNKKNFISEPHTSLFLDDPYGRFWFQYPFNNHLRDFSYYTTANLLETDYNFEDLIFSSKDGKPFFKVSQIDKYQTDTTLTDTGSDLSGIEPQQELEIYKATNRFFSSDPTINIDFFRAKYREKLDKIASFPWFADRAKPEVIGSDFTYLDLMFVDDIPEDDEFIDEEKQHHPFYTYGTSFYNKYVERNRYGATRTQYLPHDGILDGFALEEVDWDIGSLVSFSSDDFNTHIEDFSEQFDLYTASFSDWIDLIYDYFFYTLHIKLKKFVIAPFKYWEITSNSNWLKLAVDYGIWVLIIRNFINLSIFSVLSIYGFFTISRVAYYFFGENFSYGLHGLVVFLIFFFYLILILRFLFKSVNDFYKSFELEEKIAIFFSLVVFFYIFNLNGYMRNPAHTAWASSGSSTNKLLLSNNFSADWRRMATDWYPESGFQHRLEVNQQGWFIYKLSPIRPRYFYEEQTHQQFEEIVNPDRQIFGYNLSFASYPSYFNPYNFYNFIKFQIFNVTNSNFVGYTQYDRTVEINNVRHNVKSAYTLFHRPEWVNWIHVESASDYHDQAKTDIAVQGAFAVSTPALYAYSAPTMERKKYNNREFVNPINQAKVWTPYSPISAPKSTLPYDFRPKQFTEAYYSGFPKINSLVTANFENTSFNSNLSNVPDVLYLSRRDIHNYKNLIDAEGDFLAMAKSKKYKRLAYRTFGKFRPSNKNNFYENTIKLRWYQEKIFKSNFIYKYSDYLRKYLFFFNPGKAKPIRDAYMLSFKDLVPYPEFLGHGKSKIAKFTKSEYFNFLNNNQKRLYFAVLESETFESANTLIQHFSDYPKSGTTHRYYFNWIDASKFPLDYFFFEEYVDIYTQIVKDIVASIPEGASATFPRSFNFYYKIKLPILFDNFNIELREFISNSRLENIDSLGGFFSDYVNFKNLRYKNYDNLSFVEKSDLKYETKLAQANRIRRAKMLSNYFRAAKAINKQSLSDYYRSSFFLANPYKFDSFYTYAAYNSFEKGIKNKNSTIGSIFDQHHKLKSKQRRYSSTSDDRLKIYNSENEFSKPVFDLEKRLNRRLRKKKLIRRHSRRYSFGYHEYWYIEMSLWYIFLDFIIVRDLFETADSVEGVFPDYTFDYKFLDYNFNPDARQFFDIKSVKSIVTINALVEKRSTKKPTFFDNYSSEQNIIKNDFVQKRWSPEYDDDDFIAPVPRYTYADKIGGIDLPPLRTDRFNLRRPHHFSRLRSEHRSAIASDPSPYERQRKPFFGITIRDEAAFYLDKKIRPHEYDDFPFRLNNHILKSYIWFNILQRSRILYKRAGDEKNYPYNQQFIKLFNNSPDSVADYIDDFAAPLSATEWKRSKDNLFVKLPINFLSFKKPNDESPALFSKKTMRQNNPDFDYAKNSSRISDLENELILKARVKLLKNFLQDKKRYTDFQQKSFEYSEYFRDLQNESSFDARGIREILEEEDKGRYSDFFLHGLVRSDEEKGVADMVLLRARKRLILLDQKVTDNKNENN
jgi:hypothetical protein